MKILIADDDFISRSILHAALRAYGDCDLACDGKEAWGAFLGAQAAGDPYRLFVLDIGMPGLGGDEVLRRIREYEDERGFSGERMAQVIMATAMDDNGHILGTFREGCDGYIVKPYSPGRVRSELHKFLAPGTFGGRQGV